MQRSIVSFFTAEARSSSKRSRDEVDDEGNEDCNFDEQCDVGKNEISSDDDDDDHNDQVPAAAIQPQSVNNHSCVDECCDTERAEPYHPQSNVSLKKAKANRSFQRLWCNDHSWITYCITHHKLFCFTCRSAASKQLISARNKSSKSYAAFVVHGFDNWKKAKQRFREHELSQLHKEAVMKLLAVSQPSVATQLSKQLSDDQNQRRRMLLKLLSSIRFLAQQGMAFRGHVEDESNLIQLLKCRAEDVQGLTQWMENGKYLSHENINELIEMMALTILRGSLVDIKKAKIFAIIADETQDISGVEQLAVSVRWVDELYVVHEDVIGLVGVEKTDGATLASVIKNVLLRSQLHVSDCRGQAYDGASNMSGCFRGVASRLRSEEPTALYAL